MARSGAGANNSINGKVGYAPPHSKGPGDKTYVLTAYALSEPLQLTLRPSEVTRDVLLAAMKGKVLASSELRVIYARGSAKAEPGKGPETRPAVRESRPSN